MTAAPAASAIRLGELGWRPFFAAQLSAAEAESTMPVRVMAVHRGKIAVAGADGDWLIPPHIAQPPGTTPAAAEENHPAVGDWLLIAPGTLQIVRILTRASLFKRRAPGRGRKLQLIAANVDTLFIVASCNEDFSVARLERYLVLAREVGVTPLIVLTKIDLAATPETFAAAARAMQPGLLVEAVNAKDPTSVARLARRCGPGETVALLGSSGVGKSTMINSLRGSSEIATQEVRKGDGTGRHTTTVREMHRLASGGWLLDTPGMRELQLADTAEGLAEVFDEFILAALDCRFTNCAHGGEPGCAVQAGVAAGTLDAERLERWRKLTAEDAANTAGQSARKRSPRPLAAAPSAADPDD
jgi:ribosome biogenesis GTPase